MKTTIYHNPACSTSRNVLEMIRAQGIEPEIIEYLKTPPDAAQITRLVQQTDCPVRNILRSNNDTYAAFDLGNPKWSDAQLIEFIAAHPILLNRPIVVTDKGTRLCRPKEKVLEILGMSV